uniref:uncharacterized protein LOC120325929 n=1 Tax=Styela clava TaxID=7725 RepID=UPI0019394F56|nr:uncharacterized protein LOC120325929 [Styela clava]
MCTHSPAIIALCSAPAFLIFTAIVQSKYSEDSPNTVTGVMLQILRIFIRSDHVRVTKEKLEKIHRLKKIAFYAMKEKRVIFTREELEKVGINSKSIGDFIIKVPNKNYISQCLLDGEFSYFFSHQTIQEMLAALFLCEASTSEFEGFVKESLHLNHWSVVLRFTSGIMLNLSIKLGGAISLVKIDNGIEKRKILKDSLRERLRKTKEREKPFEMMELFGVLYEANDSDFIRSNVWEINFVNAVITPSGMLAISSVLRRCENLDLIRFSECGFKSEILEIMSTNLVNVHLQVKKFEFVQTGSVLDINGLSYLGSVLGACQSNELFLNFGCTGTDYKELTKSFEEAKVMLKKIAFYAMKEKRVIFTREELEKVGINSKSIGDFIIKVPNKNYISQCLLDGEFSYFFSHQTIQEMLAALFLCEASTSEFEGFVKESLHLNHWSVVLRFTSGIMLNLSIKLGGAISLVKIDNGIEKRKILKDSLRERLRKTKEREKPFEMMELFGVLYEANDSDFIRSNVWEINFVNAVITPSGMLAISSVLRRCENLDLIRFSECGFKSEILEIMSTNLVNVHLQVKKFEFVQTGSVLDINGLSYLGSVLGACQSNELFLNFGCTGTDYKELTKSFEEAKMPNVRIQKFTFEPTDEMNGPLFSAIAEFAENYADDVLVPSLLKCAEEDIDVIGEGIGCKEMVIEHVQIVNMSTERARKLGKTCASFHVQAVELDAVFITGEHLEIVKENIGDEKIQKLIVQSLKEISSALFVALADFVKFHTEELEMEPTVWNESDIGIVSRGEKCKKMQIRAVKIIHHSISISRCEQLGNICSKYDVDEIHIFRARLEAQHLQVFLEYVEDGKFNSLSIGDNYELGDEGCALVGAVVVRCEVRKLRMRECDLKTSEVKAFRENVSDATLDSLDVSYNDNLNPSVYSEIGVLVTQCQLKNLAIKDCYLEPKGIKALKDNLGDNVELQTLDFSENKADKIGKEGLSMIGEIVRKCKVESLLMKDCKFDEDQLDTFKEMIGDIEFHH